MKGSWGGVRSSQTTHHILYIYTFCFFDSLKKIKSKEERRLKAKQQKLAIKMNPSAESENPQQAQDAAGQAQKGWFLYQTVEI